MDGRQPETTPGSTKPERVVVEDQSRLLQRVYLIAGWITLLLLVIVSATLHRQFTISRLIQKYKAQSVNHARQFANASWPEHLMLLDDGVYMNSAELIEYAETSGLSETIQDIGSGQAIVRIRLYGKEGLILYSTLESETGEFTSDEELLEIVNRRWSWDQHPDVITDRRHCESFESLDGSLTDCQLVSTSVDIPGNTRQQYAIFEVIHDITSEVQAATRRYIIGTAIACTIVTIMMSIITYYLQRHQRSA